MLRWRWIQTCASNGPLASAIDGIWNVSVLAQTLPLPTQPHLRQMLLWVAARGERVGKTDPPKADVIRQRLSDRHLGADLDHAIGRNLEVGRRILRRCG